MQLKKDFSLFLNAQQGRLHFAAHSHHFWPDVTLDAQKQAWLDAAAGADLKWKKVFGEVMPSVRQGIADVLSLPDPETICFATNTHEFVLRLLSCFKKPKILTTDSEFHSFRRQVQRYAEEGLAEVTVIATEPFDTFGERFAVAASKEVYDLVFFSHVFFNSGFVAPLAQIIEAVKPKNTFIVIDGYHGFMAMPTDLSTIASRAFYMAGGYKYAMSGEGACFMHCPPGYAMRPVNTGWFAEMDTLEAEKTGSVDYAANGERFSGATFDPTGIYRMRAVFQWLRDKKITVPDIHGHVQSLQQQFLRKIKIPGELLVPDDKLRGHFLTFRTREAAQLQEKLKERDIITDNRGDRLRFGFGLYHDSADIDALAEWIKEI